MSIFGNNNGGNGSGDIFGGASSDFGSIGNLTIISLFSH